MVLGSSLKHTWVFPHFCFLSLCFWRMLLWWPLKVVYISSFKCCTVVRWSMSLFCSPSVFLSVSKQLRCLNVFLPHMYILWILFFRQLLCTQVCWNLTQPRMQDVEVCAYNPSTSTQDWGQRIQVEAGPLERGSASNKILLLSYFIFIFLMNYSNPRKSCRRLSDLCGPGNSCILHLCMHIV